MPPPARAIDWHTPDPDRGRTFTVVPFTATVAGCLEVGPAERARALDATRYLLHRLSGALADRPAEGGGESPAPAPGVVVLEVVLDASAAPHARLVLGALGTIVDEQPTTWTSEVRFRGATAETRHLGTRTRVEVAPDQVDRLLVALTPHRPRSVARLGDGAAARS